MKNYFVTGIGTGVGKTIVAAIVTEALKADYWKPLQCGDLDNTDTDVAKSLVTNDMSVFHKEAYRFMASVSPHQAAASEGVEIDLRNIKMPFSSNHVVVEGAGGIMVPLNKEGDLMIGLIKQLGADVILVSKNYLGSINHTLLTVSALNTEKIFIAGIVFNGEENLETEKIILKYTGLPCLGKVRPEASFSKEIIMKYAKSFNINLLT